MVLTDEQEKQIKEQLLKQLDKVPESSRTEVEAQIKAMSKEQLEEFLKKNQGATEDVPSCIFCAIVEGKSPALKIGENEDAIAVMDINPISKGHTLIIPKKHDTEPTESTQKFAFEIGGKILEKLKPKDITTRGAKVGDHTILNVIPIYEDTDLEKRTQVTEEELIKTASEIIGSEPKIEQPKPQEVKEPIPEKPKEPVCIFCAIANKETESFIMDENKENLAILEINPISKGHTIIIPKQHLETENIPTNAFSLAKKIAKKIKTKYKPQDVKINPTSIGNHAIIELIPIYEDTNPQERKKADPEELLKIQKNLKVKKSPPKEKKKTNKSSKKSKVTKPKRKYPNLPFVSNRIP